jgi:hypothetical protein
MKAKEIIQEQDANEAAPMGFMTRLGKTIQSKIPGNFGVAGQAELDVGKRANQLDRAFRQWAIRSGIDLNAVPAADLADFLKQQQMPPVTFSQTMYNLNDEDTLRTFWTKLAQGSYRAAGTGTAPLGQTYGVPSAAGTATNNTTSANTSQNPQNIANNINVNDVAGLINALIKKFPNHPYFNKQP